MKEYFISVLAGFVFSKIWTAAAFRPSACCGTTGCKPIQDNLIGRRLPIPKRQQAAEVQR